MKKIKGVKINECSDCGFKTIEKRCPMCVLREMQRRDEIRQHHFEEFMTGDL